MKARTLILTIAAAALIAAPGAVIAQHGPGGGPHGDGGMFGGPGGHGGQGLLRMLHRLADRLELTEDQQAQIESIIDAHRSATQSQHDQAAAAREDFRENHGPGDFDEVEYRTFFESQAQIQVELHLDGARATSEAWNVLTPEQQDELLELIELFRDGRGGPRHGGGKRVGPQ